MATKRNAKSIKNNPELFSEEVTTAPERILEELEQQKAAEIIENFSEIEQALSQQLADLPQAEIASAQERITHLLDKYYNGDRDVEFKERFAHKEEYKQELITLLKQYGITYVEKYHYPLSKDEKHIIRIDFFGRVNQPRMTDLSAIYKKYLSPSQKSISKENTAANSSTKKKRGKRKEHTEEPFFQTTTYALSEYNLAESEAWKLYRLFPRFHNLEHKMLQTIQNLHISPEDLKKLSVYDFSDILYRTFCKKEGSQDAHLFLGARQAFIKDIFKKNEKWIRTYLQRLNVHPRYIDALIKSAQSKGVCNDINIASDINTYMSEYAEQNSDAFQEFIINHIRSDNYAEDIRTRIQNNAFTIKGPALHFLQNTKHQFKQHIQKRLLEEDYTTSLYEQFNKKIPPFILKDIKNFLADNKSEFSTYLKQSKSYKGTANNLISKLPIISSPEAEEAISLFIQNKQDNFYEYLLNNNRSNEYANFALSTLSETPQLTDFGKDTIISFILANEQKFKRFSADKDNINDNLWEKIKKHGLNNELLTAIKPFILKNRPALQKYLKENSVLTFAELQQELIENRKLISQNSAMPNSMSLLNKNFALGNVPLFKDWYINFHSRQYKEEAQKTLEDIVYNGIAPQNENICRNFIQERLSNFVEFAQQYNISSTKLIKQLKSENLTGNRELCGMVHDFICRYSSTFKKSLLQHHIENKEKNFDIMIKSIKRQGLDKSSNEIIHKFIIDNQALYTQYQRKSKTISVNAETIYEHILNNKSNKNEKDILNSYLNENIYSYMIFQQDDQQLLPYVQNILKNIKRTQIDTTEEHWLKAFTEENTGSFKQFMVDKNYLNEQQGEELVKSIKQKKNHLEIAFNDGYILKLHLTVHHKNAINDSGELKQNMTNIAHINDFSNLCLFLDFWHRVMHKMDTLEPVNDRERYVARLMPTEPNIIFFGSENPEDQLSYDYKNDPRSQRYSKRLNKLNITTYGQER